MSTLHRLLLLPLPLLACAAVRADVDPSVVPADAQWVIGIDLNSLRDSSLGKGLVEMAQKQMVDASGQPAGIAIGAMRINFQKVFETIGGITAYGSNFSPDPKQIDGTLVIKGTPDLRKIVEAAAIQGAIAVPDQVRELKDLSFPGYQLGGDVIVAFPPEPVILISKAKNRLLQARDVVRGAAPSLAQGKSGPLAGLLAKSGHSFIVAASTVPAEKLFAKDAPQNRILQLIDSGMFAIGEEEPRTVTNMQLVGNSDDSAERLLKIIQGMVAMMSLAETTDKQLAEFLQSAVVEKHDRTVSVRLAYSSERLLEMAQNVQQQARAMTIVKTGPGGPVPPAAPAAGTVIAEWAPDLAPAGVAPGAELMADRLIENVSLVNGATLTLTGRRDRTSTATFDYVDILPASGAGAPLHFEAENMRLRGYRIQNVPYASKGKMIGLVGSFGTAQFDFPGEDGNYQIHVHYVEQPAGKASLSLSVKNPDSTPDSAPPAPPLPKLPAGK